MYPLIQNPNLKTKTTNLNRVAPCLRKRNHCPAVLKQTESRVWIEWINRYFTMSFNWAAGIFYQCLCLACVCICYTHTHTHTHTKLRVICPHRTQFEYFLTWPRCAYTSHVSSSFPPAAFHPPPSHWPLPPVFPSAHGFITFKNRLLYRYLDSSQMQQRAWISFIGKPLVRLLAFDPTSYARLLRVFSRWKFSSDRTHPSVSHHGLFHLMWKKRGKGEKKSQKTMGYFPRLRRRLSFSLPYNSGFSCE